jgi:DNA-binding NarL/FixJ family response regulator
MRIILADHHSQALWALKVLIDEELEMKLVGEALDSDGLLILAENNTADLILVDSELPGLYIEDLITTLHAFIPRPMVVVMGSDSENSRMLLKAGADSFVSKTDQTSWLIQHIHKYTNRAN